MDSKFDYKEAYEILEKALKEADRILRRAQLQTFLNKMTVGGTLPDEDAALQAEIDAFHQACRSHTE